MGKFKGLPWRDWIIGLVVFLAVAATWYAPVMLRHGWSFIDEFFIRHHFQRYVTNEFGHPQPIYFFPLVALAGSAPWTFLLIPAVTRLRSLNPRENPRDSLLLLAWIWALVPVIFFSFSESKLPGYILPISPALALIIGAEITMLWSGARIRALTTACWLTALAGAGLGIAFVIYSRREAPGSGWLAGLEFLPLTIAFGSIVALAGNKHRAFIVGGAGVVMSIILASVVLLFPTLSDEVSMKRLSLEAAAALGPGEKIGFYLKKEFAPVFYAEGRVLCEPRRGGTFYALHEQMLYEALETERSMIVITRPNWADGLKADSRFSIEFIGAQGDSLALRVTLKRGS
jgi:4-amino-4-deoxy-L-arabinose transferase-like glycosyltransferase